MPVTTRLLLLCIHKEFAGRNKLFNQAGSLIKSIQPKSSHFIKIVYPYRMSPLCEVDFAGTLDNAVAVVVIYNFLIFYE